MLFYWMSKQRGLRRFIAWFNKIKLDSHISLENRKKDESPLILNHFESKTFSQNGEDGILEEIFNRIGTTNKFFVEFGIEDGTENNCRYLLEKKGWKGLWIEGSPEHVETAKKHFSSYPIQIENQFITVDNINSIIESAGAPVAFDFLTVDIDGNDFYVWEKILSQYKPRVCCVEYNASVPAETSWIMPYNPQHMYQGNRNYGASLRALTELAHEKGYCLVGCDEKGVNSFFVRKDLIGDLFYKASADYTFHYRSPKYHRFFFGHPNI